MNQLIDKLKTRANVRLKGILTGDRWTIARSLKTAKKKRLPVPHEWKIQDTLNIISIEVGFQHWEHARLVLSGEATVGDDMGHFWYNLECEGIVSHWYATCSEAKSLLSLSPKKYLIPYGRQFIVVRGDFIEGLNVDSKSEHWEKLNNDLMSGYSNSSWLALCNQRLDAFFEKG